MKPDPGPANLLPASAIGRASASEAEGSRFESAAGCHYRLNGGLTPQPGPSGSAR